MVYLRTNYTNTTTNEDYSSDINSGDISFVMMFAAIACILCLIYCCKKSKDEMEQYENESVIRATIRLQYRNRI